MHGKVPVAILYLLVRWPLSTFRADLGEGGSTESAQAAEPGRVLTLNAG